MHVVEARNVQHALLLGLDLLNKHGRRRSSRNGDVIVMDTPITTHYKYPRERVLFWPERDANPFFHFFESLWMLAGRNDVGYVKQFVQRMAMFSDDGLTFNGAYGYRWRKHFDVEGGGASVRLPDQLATIVRRLKADPDDRRCVLANWDPVADLDSPTKDACCNTHVYFTRNWRGDLDMTVCCRSNDMIWGGYGANAVHFSVLQEVLAAGIGCGVGGYWQVSNNYHAYCNVFYPLLDKLEHRIQETGARIAFTEQHVTTVVIHDPYVLDGCKPYPIVNPVNGYVSWMEQVERFVDASNVLGRSDWDPFFSQVATPLELAHRYYKEKNFQLAKQCAAKCEALDWRKACLEWLLRRESSFRRAEDDGPSYES